VTWHSFPADACSDATARCTAAKLLPFAAPLLGAGDEASGDDEASVVPLTVGHVASHAPSRRPRSPPPRPPGQGLDRVHQMKTCVTPDEKKRLEGVTGRDFLRRRPQIPFGGHLAGGKWICS
jgi:hypothetical protein